MLIPFATNSYRSRSLPLSAQRCVNIFAEVEPESTKTPVALFGAPGLSAWTAIGDQPIRVMRMMSGTLYVVGGSTLYSITSTGVVTPLGSVGSASGPIMMSDNGAQLFILNNGMGWVLSTAIFSSQGPLGSEQHAILVGSTTTILDAHVALDTQFVVAYTQTALAWQPGDHVSILLGNGNIFDTALANTPVVATIFIGVPLTKATQQFAIINDSTQGKAVRSTDTGAIGDLHVNVTSVEGMVIGDNVDITYFDGTVLSTPITNLVRGPLVTTIAGLPSATPAGASISNTQTRLYPIFDPNFFQSTTVTYFDNYFVLTRTGTNEFFISALGDGTTYPGLSYAAAQVASDNVVGAIANHEMLLIFGERTIETWYNAGSPNFPLQRYDGATIERGCSAPFTIIKEDNSVFFLGDDKIFYKLQGVVPQRLSTHAIETAWSRYATVSDALCMTYTTEGHKFIVVTFPSAPATWVFDVSTNLWHERDSVNPPSTTTQLGRWRGNCAVAAYGMTLIGDLLSGIICKLDWGNYTELNSPIIGQVVSPPYKNDRRRIFVSRFELEMETGVGLAGNINSVITLAAPITFATSIGNYVVDTTADPLVPNFSTKIAVDAPAGSTLIVLDNIVDIGLGDTIQVFLDDGSVFETTVLNVYAPTNPEIFLDYSKDGGFTFSKPQQPRTLGKQGQVPTRVRWMSLGQAREWYFRLTISDPVPRVIIAAYSDMYAGE